MAQAPSLVIPGRFFDHIEKQESASLTFYYSDDLDDMEWTVTYHYGEEAVEGEGLDPYQAFSEMLKALESE